MDPVEDILANPAKYKAEWSAKAKAENPALTDEQIENAWAQLAHQMGLEASPAEVPAEPGDRFVAHDLRQTDDGTLELD